MNNPRETNYRLAISMLSAAFLSGIVPIDVADAQVAATLSWKVDAIIDTTPALVDIPNATTDDGMSAMLLSPGSDDSTDEITCGIGYDIFSSRHDYGNINQEDIVSITCDADGYFVSWTDDDVMICFTDASCTLRTN